MADTRVGSQENASYATGVGLIYVFNLIIGTGALALPRAFADAGYGLGMAVLTVSCAISYMNATFVIECMAAANAVIMSKRMQRVKHIAVQNTTDAASPSATTATQHLPAASTDDMQIDQPMLISRSPSVSSLHGKHEYFDIVHRTELSEIARMFLGNWGVVVFFAILGVYLFGDLAIYSAVVPKSLLNVVCISNATCPAPNAKMVYDEDESSLCRPNWSPFWTRITVYRLLVVAFTCVAGPFVYVGMQKTKYLQMMTTVARWAAFLLMIALATKRITDGEATGHPPVANANKFASLFGISVYAFMCQHSLPAVVTPMRRKKNINVLLAVVFLLILVFYTLLSLTGSFAFDHIQDVYTLQFMQRCGGGAQKMHWYSYLFEYFLALFPVFTISMNFPIVGVTLCNNLRSLLGWQTEVTYADVRRSPVRRSALVDDTPDSEPLITDTEDDDELDMMSTNMSTQQPVTQPTLWTWACSAVLLPTGVLIIPVVVALITDDIEMLASGVGAYAGAGVQFVIPAMLTYAARRRVKEWLHMDIPSTHASPFQHWLYPIFMLVWAAITVFVVTLNYALAV